MVSPFGTERDRAYMLKALAQARKAYAQDEVPVGALVVDALGAIIGRGYNRAEKSCFQGAHAEALALARAGKKQGDWRLEGCWVYVTLEPCAMCMSLIAMSRCQGVVFGAISNLFGYHLVDNESSSWVYKKDALRVISGVRADEAAQLLKQFFKKKREQL